MRCDIAAREGIMTVRSDEPFAVDALVRLEEVNQRRKLPRVGRILRPIETPNVWDHPGE